MKPPLYSANRDHYWNTVESLRSTSEPRHLPDNSFDFVSIHHREGEGYSLLSPMLLCTDSTRPRFEKRRFPTLAVAKRYACRLARKVRSILGKAVHVVNCCE